MLDNKVRSCHGDRAYHIAVGHLGTPQFYSYGDFSWRARIHHAPDGSAPPPNCFTCFSVYTNYPYHNELAWCFDAADPHAAHLSHWYDAKMRRAIVRTPSDLTRGFHTFTTRWRDVGVDWLLDGQVLHQVRGTKGRSVPWEPMSLRIIIRPINKPSYFLGDAHLDVTRVSYTPSSDASDLSSLPPPPPPPSPSPVLPLGASCRSDICDDEAADCCAAHGDFRGCRQPGYFVARGGRSSYSECVSRFGSDAVYQCCVLAPPPLPPPQPLAPPPLKPSPLSRAPSPANSPSAPAATVGLPAVPSISPPPPPDIPTVPAVTSRTDSVLTAANADEIILLGAQGLACVLWLVGVFFCGRFITSKCCAPPHVSYQVQPCTLAELDVIEDR